MIERWGRFDFLWLIECREKARWNDFHYRRAQAAAAESQRREEAFARAGAIG